MQLINTFRMAVFGPMWPSKRARGTLRKICTLKMFRMVVSYATYKWLGGPYAKVAPSKNIIIMAVLRLVWFSKMARGTPRKICTLKKYVDNDCVICRLQMARGALCRICAFKKCPYMAASYV